MMVQTRAFALRTTPTGLPNSEEGKDMHGRKACRVLVMTLLLITAQGTPVTPETASPESDLQSTEATLGLERSDVRLIQLGLTAEGFDSGPADGLIGRRTREALSRWQRSLGKKPTGYLDAETAELLTMTGNKHKVENEALLEAQERPIPQGQSTTDMAAPKPLGPRWAVTENQPCQVYNPHDRSLNPITVTWSGECADGRATGEGQLVWRINDLAHSYTGRMRDGRRHGRGAYAWANGNRYEGQWRAGRRHGRGIMTWNSGARYEGQWRHDRLAGHGVYFGADGSYYEGELDDNEKHGEGLWIWPDGGYYLGGYQYGKQHGRGARFWADGDRYEGEWRHDRPNGHGTLTWANGRYHEGEWRNGCFGKRDGYWATVGASAAACGFE